MINSVSLSGTQLTVGGTGFSATPLSLSFNGKSVSIGSSSSTQVVGTLTAIPTRGSFRVGVKCDTASASSYMTISAPNVVETFALFNQTTTIEPTIFWTPTTTGLYRMSLYLRETVAGTSTAQWGVTVEWND